MSEERLPSLVVDTFPAINLSYLHGFTSYADLEDHFWQSDALGTAFDKTYRTEDDEGNLTSEYKLHAFFNNVAAVGSMKYVNGKETECFPQETEYFFCREIFSFMMTVHASPTGCAFLASLMPQYLEDFLKKHPGVDKVRDEHHIIRSFIQEIKSLSPLLYNIYSRLR